MQPIRPKGSQWGALAAGPGAVDDAGDRFIPLAGLRWGRQPRKRGVTHAPPSLPDGKEVPGDSAAGDTRGAHGRKHAWLEPQPGQGSRGRRIVVKGDPWGRVQEGGAVVPVRNGSESALRAGMWGSGVVVVGPGGAFHAGRCFGRGHQCGPRRARNPPQRGRPNWRADRKGGGARGSRELLPRTEPGACLRRDAVRQSMPGARGGA
jgi:hypothetical protein